MNLMKIFLLKHKLYEYIHINIKVYERFKKGCYIQVDIIYPSKSITNNLFSNVNNMVEL